MFQVFRDIICILPYIYSIPSLGNPDENFHGFKDAGNPEDTILKSYKQLDSIFEIFFRNITLPDGEKMKIHHFFGYGCHCLPANGSPMTAGNGKPIDDIDHVCFQRKRCMKCLTMVFPNETCNTADTKYRFKDGSRSRIDKRSGVENYETRVVCKDAVGTCARAVCECDLRMVEDLHAGLKSREIVYDERMHLFTGEFDRKLMCLPSGTGMQHDSCCIAENGYGMSYTSATSECCADGYPKRLGTC